MSGEVAVWHPASALQRKVERIFLERRAGKDKASGVRIGARPVPHSLDHGWNNA
jgi:hypothetical protein